MDRERLRGELPSPLAEKAHFELGRGDRSNVFYGSLGPKEAILVEIGRADLRHPDQLPPSLLVTEVEGQRLVVILDGDERKVVPMIDRPSGAIATFHMLDFPRSWYNSPSNSLLKSFVLVVEWEAEEGYWKISRWPDRPAITAGRFEFSAPVSETIASWVGERGGIEQVDKAPQSQVEPRVVSRREKRRPEKGISDRVKLIGEGKKRERLGELAEAEAWVINVGVAVGRPVEFKGYVAQIILLGSFEEARVVVWSGKKLLTKLEDVGEQTRRIWKLDYSCFGRALGGRSDLKTEELELWVARREEGGWDVWVDSMADFGPLSINRVNLCEVDLKEVTRAPFLRAKSASSVESTPPTVQEPAEVKKEMVVQPPSGPVAKRVESSNKAGGVEINRRHRLHSWGLGEIEVLVCQLTDNNQIRREVAFEVSDNHLLVTVIDGGQRKTRKSGIGEKRKAPPIVGSDFKNTGGEEPQLPKGDVLSFSMTQDQLSLYWLGGINANCVGNCSTVTRKEWAGSIENLGLVEWA